ncbi:transglutaminase-like domain-containing protein [Microbulbifer aggregans]|uniref:transglutaminase-like domain-containing protein n=1 Tax=Microbulbifer aggregans TaxID=1769779 RepID=UPI001CFF41E2|nr:transglutaminase family protein [Microbulbifer aggregans]
MEKFLQTCAVVDWMHPEVFRRARQLARGAANQNGVVKNCFEFVRDEIKHSWDYCMNPVTCTASEVLLAGTGYCYAKSHLLAALLRANEIPSGLCYQRLSMDEEGKRFCLHGLNAVYLDAFGWYRLDARGNKPGVTAGYAPPIEVLAFAELSAGERNLPDIYVEPLPAVVDVLRRSTTYIEVSENLPDH